MIETIGLIAAIMVPLWNIPLIMRIIKRRSSKDISLYWALGVWICFICMAPAGVKSSDLVWRVFNIANLTLFTCVVAVVLWYRFKEK